MPTLKHNQLPMSVILMLHSLLLKQLFRITVTTGHFMADYRKIPSSHIQHERKQAVHYKSALKSLNHAGLQNFRESKITGRDDKCSFQLKSRITRPLKTPLLL